MDDEVISLMQAATVIRRSYAQTLRMVLTGELEGWQDSTRKWRVSKTDAERVALREVENHRAIPSRKQA